MNGISFAVERGEVFGLLGPNGAGKSTLIRMLTTLVLPTEGTAVVDGADIVARIPNAVRHAIGVIPQAMTSDLELSARENLLIFAKLYSVPRAKREKLIPELLAAVELTAWADKPVKQLSGGMRRRVEIARGLVHEPRIFFLDEPTTGLDPVSRTAVWEMLRKIKAGARPHDPAHDALYGRGRQAVRPDRDRRSRRAQGARYTGAAQGRRGNGLARRGVRAFHRKRSPRRDAGSVAGRPSGVSEITMDRMLAIIERELRRFRRSPALIVMSLMMPVVQLVVLGYAFGGTVKRLQLGSSIRITACRR